MDRPKEMPVLTNNDIGVKGLKHYPETLPFMLFKYITPWILDDASLEGNYKTNNASVTRKATTIRTKPLVPMGLECMNHFLYLAP